MLAHDQPVFMKKILLSNRDKINATREGKSHWTFALILT